jgi:hypothetical protein
MQSLLMTRVSLICVFLLLTGCASGPETDSRPIPAAWTADVRAMVGTEPGGFATVTVLPDGETRANLTLRGATAGGHHPWRIREGRCPGGDSEPGPVGNEVGGAGAYPPLEPNASGNASRTAILALMLERDAEYHLDVYESEENMSVVACGDLQRSN